MKKSNLKTLILTCAVCLLPMIFGAVFYEKLPEEMPVHFNMNNEVDRYSSKEFALFGIPAIMLGMQIFCCVISYVNEDKKGKKPRFIGIVEWIIPILSVVISVITIEVPLGSDVDVRKSILLILGILYLLMGNYMPKTSYEEMKGKMHPMPKNEKMYRKMMRMMGYTFVVFGLLLLVSIFFEAIVSCVIILAMVTVLLVETVWVYRKNK